MRNLRVGDRCRHVDSGVEVQVDVMLGTKVFFTVVKAEPGNELGVKEGDTASLQKARFYETMALVEGQS